MVVHHRTEQILATGLEPDLVDFRTMPDMKAPKVRGGLMPKKSKVAPLATLRSCA